MNILVIGNGFDLAHGLPTKYGDFLEFCARVKGIYDFPKDASLGDYKAKYIDDWEMNDYIKTALLKAFERRHKHGVKITYKVLEELYEHIRENTWLEYFLKCRSFVGENWIDFESEISRVVQSLDEAINIIKDGRKLEEMPREKHSILISIHESSNGSMKKVFKDDATLNDFAAFLNTELERLIRALEIYIVEFVRRIPVAKKNVDIEKIEPDCMLSFNYSDTYERIYGERGGVECDYIHGKADINKNVRSSNLVLGIDEYLGDDRKNKELELLPFKKFYQRIYKSTGNKYLNWVDEIKDEYADYINPNILPTDKGYPGHTLYIFGHSLDATDQEVLRLLICNDNVETKIFYYRKDEEDKAELGKMIKNLIMIMGQEELIRRTGGSHKTIEFVPQTLEN